MIQQTSRQCITFETKCYENDWEYLLMTDYLDKMILNCNINFQFKQLIINNVKDSEKVKKYAEKKIEEKIIDTYYFVNDYIDEVLKYFDIDKNSLGRGYYYSSAELVGLYFSRTKYHLHFSSDSFMPKNNNSKWVINAYNILEDHSKYIVANPKWNFNYKATKEESIGENIGDFFVGYGFSDQCYMVKTEVFKRKIYNYKHQESERYPKYGGELFEKRVDSYMRTKCLYRITSMKESYVHHNFPKRKWKIITLLLIKLNIYYFVSQWSIKCKNKLKEIYKQIKKRNDT